MMDVTIKITGLKKTISNLTKLGNIINADAHIGLTGGLNILTDGAIQKLNGMIGTGRWGPWGKSSDSIRDKSNWKIITISPTKLNLECISNHAAVVELGTVGAAMVEGGPFPIGKQQGLEPIYRTRFAVQRGYHYLTSAKEDKSIQTRMVEEMAKSIINSIKKVTF
jgi:hypothetical protein